MTPTRRQVLRLAQVALVLQVLLVASGTAVRVTGSGLGCPTWPRCSGGSLVNTPALGAHGSIEFANRLLAVVLELVGIALVIAVLRLRPRAGRAWTRLALVQAMVVPLQALVGGVLVLTHLNPYVLIAHFLFSFPLIAAAAALVQRVHEGDAAREPLARAELRWLTRALVTCSGIVLVAGTLVTGTGPHAGDPRVPRLPFSPREVTQLHADLVFLLVGLTAATAVAAGALNAPDAVRRGARALVMLIVAQAGLGYWQYVVGVPPVLVVLHVLGASLVFTVAVRAHLATVGPPGGAPPVRSAPPPLAHAAGAATDR